MDLTPEGQAMNRLQPSIEILQDALGRDRPSDDRRKNRVQFAIYKLDGDDLTICLSMLERRRPTEFETNADSWRVLLTCKRKKPSDEQKRKNVPVPSSEVPHPLPQDVQRAWMKAGAQVGWQGMKDILVLDFQTMPEGLVGVVPAFRFTAWNEGTVGKLPAPNVPFGLDLVGTEATDAALKDLATLESLHTLDLSFTELTDDGLKNLSSLKSLHVLCLVATKVTDLGLKELAGLKSLDTLELRALNVTDVGLKELAGLKTLKSLDLCGTKITDAGVKELAGLKTLKSLDLSSTKITDAGVKELAGMSSLQRLDLTDTRVTDAGLMELKKALPDCQIVD
jgi:Leucine-rich repeat (LRR) protein